jgi:hypothetical protein
LKLPSKIRLTTAHKQASINSVYSQQSTSAPQSTTQDNNMMLIQYPPPPLREYMSVTQVAVEYERLIGEINRANDRLMAIVKKNDKE